MSVRTYWQLRFRSPLSQTKGVDDVIIETETDDESRARVVAQDYLATKMAHPQTLFVFLRPMVAHSEREMLRNAAPAPELPAAKAENPRRTAPNARGLVNAVDTIQTPIEGAGTPAKAEKSGRIGQ